jgi:triosephosphate isomerase
VRQRLIAGNWKLNKTASQADAFVRQLLALVTPPATVEVVLAPPFTALAAVQAALSPAPRFKLAAQNLFWEDQGAYTGEVSAPMLKDLGCDYVIVGHSERRYLFGERDDGINKKVLSALRHRLGPILCVGETLAQRERGATETVVTEQLLAGLSGVSKESLDGVTIAYEPVWAIGTGRAATAAQAQAVHETLRALLVRTWGAGPAERVRILYGGSVAPANARQFLTAESVDGALVGGACLDPDSFARIIALAAS